MAGMSSGEGPEPIRLLVLLLGSLAAALTLAPGGVASETPDSVCARNILAMGNTTVGTPLVRSFLLQNPDSEKPVRIHAFSAHGPGFAVQPPAETIPAGGSVSFTATLQAEAAGNYRAWVAAYLETDPESGLDPLVSCVIEGEVKEPSSYGRDSASSTRHDQHDRQRRARDADDLHEAEALAERDAGEEDRARGIERSERGDDAQGAPLDRQEVEDVGHHVQGAAPHDDRHGGTGRHQAPAHQQSRDREQRDGHHPRRDRGHRPAVGLVRSRHTRKSPMKTPEAIAIGSPVVAEPPGSPARSG